MKDNRLKVLKNRWPLSSRSKAFSFDILSSSEFNLQDSLLYKVSSV